MARSEMTPKSSLTTSSGKEVDDDDCVLLEDDPENSVSAVNDAGGSDELLIVGERGQIACKDYPHSRHICANFPFSSTPHQTHCDQCYCYICDSPAPCLHWGTGLSSSDHCHATDKEDIWQLKRRNFKLQRSPSLQVRTPDTSFSMPTHQPIITLFRPELNAVPPSHVFWSTSLPISRYPDTSMQMPLSQPNPYSPPIQLDLNTMPQSCVSRPTTIHPSSSLRQGGSQQPGFVTSKNRFYPRQVLQKLHRVQSNNIHGRDMVQNLSAVGPQLASSHATFNQSGYNWTPYSRTFPPMANSADNNPGMWQDSGPEVNMESGTYQHHPNMGSFFPNTVPSQPPIYGPVPSQPPIYGPPVSQSNKSQNIYQHGNQFQNGLSTSQSNQQPQAGNTQIQNAQPTREPSVATEINSQPCGNVNRNLLYLDFEHWLLEKQPVSVSQSKYAIS